MIKHQKSTSRFDFAINNILPKSKRSQHEIAGFVLIVLIVTVIGVVFLSLTYGRPEVGKETSAEVSNLLTSAMQHTTDCAINYIPQYRNVQDLVKECYKDKSGEARKCLDGRDVCQELEKNLKNLLDKGLVIGEGSVNKAYKVDIYAVTDSISDSDSDRREEILSFVNGNFVNCTSIVGGSHPIPVGSFGFGKIETELLVCKS